MYKEEQDALSGLDRLLVWQLARVPMVKREDLFALRKCRKKTDFLEQINRLQFKLGNELVIPNDVYEGKLTDKNFTEFKQFLYDSCVK